MCALFTSAAVLAVLAGWPKHRDLRGTAEVYSSVEN